MTSKTTHSAVDIRKVEMEAARLRAEAIADAIVAVGRLVARAWAAVSARIAAAREAARVRRELGALSDRELADIGIMRADIPAIAAGIYQRQPADTLAEEARTPKQAVIEAPTPAFRKAA
ncbi:uncharacterized protein DUF1127 [Tepidamorphus gemmatus]|jgi:uncharacterized protein YjiS (DUF1127 family)|uniref:Uncharacterized protein DUF1127 n=1 Tax=Tepidamorphus gemmatus TaxID=747076 RepID=A0A4R3LVS4_9HYPH|nr:uncharacterized protein DUF1127 [Tepidamorphus gemmatus]